MTIDTTHIGFLLYPGVTQLDATGPAQVLAYVPGTKIHMVWKETGPVDTDAGFAILANQSFETCPDLDVIVVPGGPGQTALMKDKAVHAFLRHQAAHARFVTSVCTGSLLLAAAGLLHERRSTCHWGFRDILSQFGAEPAAERVARDGRFFSGGGVTAGIDFGLTLAAELAGDDTARTIQLFLEYDPEPPFHAGSPETADPETLATVKAAFAEARKGFMP